MKDPGNHANVSLTKTISHFAGVYLSFGRAVTSQNNTCASISDIGSSPPHQLACVTDKTACCQNQGQWYYPNGSQIRGSSESSDQNSYYMERTNEGSINLFRISSTLKPHGEFCCRIADASDVTHTVCIDLGEFYGQVYH